MQHLLGHEQVSSEMLQSHLIPNTHHPESLHRIYFALCSSLKNKQMHENVFKGTIGSLDNLSKPLFDFDPHKIVNIYAQGDWRLLMESILNSIALLKEPRTTEKSVIPQFCKGAISAAYFFNQFKDSAEFYSWANFFDQDDRARVALPLLLSQEIHGLGFALACDFLKELGYVGFGKPDVHIKDIFQALELMPSDNSINEDLAAFKAIVRIANNTGRTAYEVDKVFWLLGSGEFYRSKVVIPSQKKIFIEKAKKALQLA